MFVSFYGWNFDDARNYVGNSGEFYDFAPLDENNVVGFVGDVIEFGKSAYDDGYFFRLRVEMCAIDITGRIPFDGDFGFLESEDSR
jgi:hypothetical protein